MRLDIVELETESDLISIYPMAAGVKHRKLLHNHKLSAVQEGLLMQIVLEEEYGYLYRLVVDEPLNDQESAEWVGKIEWYLNISDGKLAIEDGFSPSDEDVMRGFSILKIYLT